MEKNLYIDASHPDETRVVLKSNSSIEEYEYENKNKLNFYKNLNLVWFKLMVFYIFLKLK